MSDFIIVGGGIVGLMTARELAGRGATVSVVERGEIGREASWAGGGILSPVRPWQQSEAVTRLVQWGQAEYPNLAEQLRAETGIDPEWTPGGLLIVDEPKQAAAARAWAEGHRAALSILGPAEARAIVPALEPGEGEALWWPEVAQIRNPRLLQALAAAARQHGIGLLEQQEVRRVVCRGGRATGVETAGGLIEGGAVVVAGGAWSAALLADTGLRLEVSPVRGQILLFQGPPGLLTPVIAAREHYLVPRRDGHVLVGSTVERAGFDKATTAGAREELQAAAQRLVPALADFPVVKHWAGLRPGSAEGIPVIGPHPQLDRLYVNTGHYRNGLSLAPGSARLLADLATGQAPSLDPAPYLPAAQQEAAATSKG